MVALREVPGLFVYSSPVTRMYLVRNCMLKVAPIELKLDQLLHMCVCHWTFIMLPCFFYCYVFNCCNVSADCRRYAAMTF